MDGSQNQYLNVINFTVIKINVYMGIFQGLLNFYCVSNAFNYSLLILLTPHTRQKSNNPLLKCKHVQNEKLWTCEMVVKKIFRKCDLQSSSDSKPQKMFSI
jgi:hypothetical protein